MERHRNHTFVVVRVLSLFRDQCYVQIKSDIIDQVQMKF